MNPGEVSQHMMRCCFNDLDFEYLGDKVYCWMSRNISTWEVKIMIIGEFGRSLVICFNSFYQSPSKFRNNWFKWSSSDCRSFFVCKLQKCNSEKFQLNPNREQTLWYYIDWSSCLLLADDRSDCVLLIIQWLFWNSCSIDHLNFIRH